MLDDWTRDSLAEHLNTTFRLHHERWGQVEWELSEVSEQKKQGQQQVYTIVFRGPLAQPFGQGMVEISHDRLGDAKLFVVPIDQEGDLLRYEAVFNRLVE